MTDSKPRATATVEDAGRWLTATIGPRGFRTDVSAGRHLLPVDEPVAVGGNDAGPTPYEFLLASLAGCTLMTLRLYADRKGFPLEGAKIYLRSARSHELDCEKCETEKVGIGHIQRKLELVGPLTDDQRSRLLAIVERCPIKQTLEQGIHIDTVDALTA